MISIDEKISAIQVELYEYSKTLEFNELCEFSMTNLENIPWEEINCQGLYLIEIKNDLKHNVFSEWANDFCKRWGDERYVKRWVSNPKKMRLVKHKELGDWIPLYIGKSRKIKKRIHEHIHLKLEQPTTGMKLKARENMQDEIFRISYISMPIQNYDWVMYKLERILRDRINPILGRQ